MSLTLVDALIKTRTPFVITLQASELFLTLSGDATLLISKSEEGKHSYELRGVPGQSGKWRLPLNADSARLVLSEVACDEPTKELLMSLLTSKAWQW